MLYAVVYGQNYDDVELFTNRTMAMKRLIFLAISQPIHASNNVNTSYPCMYEYYENEGRVCKGKMAYYVKPMCLATITSKHTNRRDVASIDLLNLESLLEARMH